jgi:hypothetical protein
LLLIATYTNAIDYGWEASRKDGAIQDNGNKFWYAHIFMESVGLRKLVILPRCNYKAMGSCAKLGIDPTEAFTLVHIH